MKIACVDKEMKAILETGYYRIPRFQRPYSWERENIEDFWNDTIINNELYVLQTETSYPYLQEYIQKFGPVNYELMTIEHLAPQNPRPGSSVKLPHVSLLGNLILVDNSLNRSLGNNDFAQKQRDLLKSRVWMDETIRQAKKWTEADIEARTKQLAELAYNKVWAIKV